MDTHKALREHVLELLDGKSAHIDLETAIKAFPISQIHTRIENSPHTGWELVEHIRIAQSDILEFSRDAHHISPEFPDGYWNTKIETAEDWRRSTEQILSDLQAMRDIVADEGTDLFAAIPHGSGQTFLREALLVADHNAYHLGQLTLIRRTLDGNGS